MLKRNSGKWQGIVKTLLCSLFILALPACSGTPADDDDPNPTTPPASGTDADHDGVTVEAGDCDDSNPDVNPSADELCDGIDNN